MLPDSSKQWIIVHEGRRIKTLIGKELGNSFANFIKRFEIARMMNFLILYISPFLRHGSKVGFLMARVTGNGGFPSLLIMLRVFCAGCVLLCANEASSGPFAEPGDPFLRHDLQLLRDAGVIESSISTWPLSMGGIHSALHDAELPDDSSYINRLALERMKLLLDLEKQPGWSPTSVRVSVRSESPLLRSFLNTPREKQEAMVTTSWLGDRYAGRLNVSGGFDRVTDWRGRTDDALRFDGSYLAARLGNYSLSLDQLDRWWGPGWDGSLILSNNARPVPALTVQRRVPQPFEGPCLGWLGPWNTTTFMGRMEDERTGYPRPWLFGSRVDFAPIIVPGLEIGLSRTIQWGGQGRPNGVDTFLDALLSQDNVTPGSVAAAEEPGNQLAGVDLRYRLPGKTPVAFYGQWIGEDEDKFLPNAIMNLYGLEIWGAMEGGSWRAFFERVDTSVWWWTDEARTKNIAYNHHLYSDGYRHRGRTLGHAADTDSKLTSLGFICASDAGRGYGLVLREGILNSDDSGNSSVSNGKATDLVSVDLFTRWDTDFGRITLGLGWEDLESSTGTETEFTGFIRLNRSF
tara:strand:- start:330 stop:2051 length:1722 start_codon:yes stop_codon:yes gene_type:complete